jgi:predicted permease
MVEMLPQLAPIFFFFSIGVALRRLGVASRSDGDFVLRLVFFVTLPLLILLTLSRTALTGDKIMLPIANIVVNVFCLAAMLVVTRPLKLPRASLGSMAMNTMIANNAFMFPFILTIYGDIAFADAVLFDFGNAIMVATVTFAVAFHYSDEPYQRFAMLRRVVSSPFFWSLAAGVVLSVTGTDLPELTVAVIDPVAQMTAPLILIALGIFFSFSFRQIRLVGLSLFIRMGLGLMFGVAFAAAVGLDDQAFVVVALCSAAPIGFMALTFSSMAKLDTELTASSVSLSILAGLVYVPLLMLLLRSLEIS